MPETTNLAVVLAFKVSSLCTFRVIGKTGSEFGSPSPTCSNSPKFII